MDEFNTYFYIIGWKNISIGIGNYYMSRDPEKSFDIFYQGLFPSKNTDNDKDNIDTLKNLNFDQIISINVIKETLADSCILASHYSMTKDIKKMKKIQEFLNNVYEKYRNNEEIMKKNDKIRSKISNKIKIGYLSPDINKNAVTLFLEPLLKYYNKEKFEIFVFYRYTRIL